MPGALAKLTPFGGPEHQPFEIGDGPGGVLLIHGFPGTPAEVRAIGETLASNGWRAKGLLLPGFGPDIIHLEQRRRKDWLQAARISFQELRTRCSPAAILGYSMGGAVALYLAAELQPDRLVLAAPFWRLPGLVPRFVTLFARLNLRIQPFKKANFGDSNLRRQFERIAPEIDLDDPETQQAIRTEFYLPLQAIAEVIYLGREAYQNAPAVRSPALVLQGAQDPMIRPVETRRLAARLPAHLTTYAELECGHDLIAGGCGHAEASQRIIDFLGNR